MTEYKVSIIRKSKLREIIRTDFVDANDPLEAPFLILFDCLKIDGEGFMHHIGDDGIIYGFKIEWKDKTDTHNRLLFGYENIMEAFRDFERRHAGLGFVDLYDTDIPNDELASFINQ